MLFQFFFKETCDGAEEMETGVASLQEVVAVGVNLFAEKFSGLHVCFFHFGEVAEMHVVVGCSVDKKEVTAEL